MIHYHGTPIGGRLEDAVRTLAGKHAFVSFAMPAALESVMEVCQSFALDNGAFSAWRSGKPITDWSDFYLWVDGIRNHPGFDWAVIPDVIDGTEADNDRLIEAWPFDRQGVPVWHLHESTERLRRLAEAWPRVALGSSGEFSKIGTDAWWIKMGQGLRTIVDKNGQPTTKLHGLRMLDGRIVERIPFSSADSTNVARNVSMDTRWKSGVYQPPVGWRGAVMVARIESVNSSASFDPAEWPVPLPEEIDIASLFSED